MFNNIFSSDVINKLISIKNDVGTNINFHKKAHKILPELGSIKFISKVFEQNLKHNSFLNKQWTSCEIPQLTVYEDDEITIRYHFFLPVKSLNNYSCCLFNSSSWRQYFKLSYILWTRISNY